MKRRTRFLALMLVFVTLFCSLSIGASAATSYKNKTKTFYVRLSKNYNAVGTVTIKSTNADGTKGTITFTKVYNNKYTHENIYGDYEIILGNNMVGDAYTFEKGVSYSYTISKMKDGGKITLTNLNNFYYDVPTKLTGKIHISGSNNWNNIWKIDTLYTLGVVNVGLYFRNT